MLYSQCTRIAWLTCYSYDLKIEFGKTFHADVCMYVVHNTYHHVNITIT